MGPDIVAESLVHGVGQAVKARSSSSSRQAFDSPGPWGRGRNHIAGRLGCRPASGRRIRRVRVVVLPLCQFAQDRGRAAGAVEIERIGGGAGEGAARWRRRGFAGSPRLGKDTGEAHDLETAGAGRLLGLAAGGEGDEQ